jgi:hypothetical protein
MPVQLTDRQQRRKRNERAFKRQRRNIRAVKGVWPARDPQYLDWLRTLECILPWCTSKNLHKWPEAGAWTEAAHTGPHGLSQKASDHGAIPLCHYHHQEAKDAQGKDRNWFEKNGLDRRKVLADLRARYLQERAA